MKKPFLLMFLFLSIFLVSNASADPITFIYTGYASGSYSYTTVENDSDPVTVETSFGSTLFTITAISDTSNLITDSYNIRWIDNTSAFISIENVIEGTFTVPTYSFFNSNNCAVGFTGPYLDLFDIYQPTNPVIETTWSMTTSIGPVSGPGETMQWTYDTISISTGSGPGIVTLVLDTDSCDGTYQAIVTSSAPVPEPATMLLFGSGLVGLAGFGRKKFKK